MFEVKAKSPFMGRIRVSRKSRGSKVMSNDPLFTLAESIHCQLSSAVNLETKRSEVMRLFIVLRLVTRDQSVVLVVYCSLSIQLHTQKNVAALTLVW